ncbi:hypothetical protein EDD64_12951 [Effusibacillus lacus]|nr:hypothetical protein EDD64_12951 [Effusibacillus lacus]
MEYKNLLVEVENGIDTITINRPEVRNGARRGICDTS